MEYKTTWAASVIHGSSVRDTVNLTVRTLTKPSVLSKSIVGPSANYTCNLAYYSNVFSGYAMIVYDTTNYFQPFYCLRLAFFTSRYHQATRK